jgi:hypothetical protein
LPRRPFAPTPRQINVLLCIGFVSLGYALYLRYLAIEYTPVGLACQAGAQTWLCATRRAVMLLFNNTFFGWVAFGAATLNLIRPSIVLMAIALVAGGFGIVLYNIALSSLAVALLILSLARRQPAEE